MFLLTTEIKCADQFIQEGYKCETESRPIIQAVLLTPPLASAGNTSTTPTYYVFDDDEPLLKLNTNGSEAAVTTFDVNGITTRHTGNSYFYTWDPQGSPVQKFTGTNTLTYTRMYDAFGDTYYSDSNSDSYNSFGGQWGYWTDTGTGLCQLGHRFYDPSTGRFVTRDPIGYAGSVNIYGYTGNDPIQFIDPTGLLAGVLGFGMSMEGLGGGFDSTGILAPVGITIGVIGIIVIGVGVVGGIMNYRRHKKGKPNYNKLNHYPVGPSYDPDPTKHKGGPHIDFPRKDGTNESWPMPGHPQCPDDPDGPLRPVN